MTILTNADFNVVVTNSNGEFVRISELNKMIQYGAINIDEKKLKDYKFDTTVIYNKNILTREEAMKIWKEN